MGGMTWIRDQRMPRWRSMAAECGEGATPTRGALREMSRSAARSERVGRTRGEYTSGTRTPMHAQTAGPTAWRAAA